MSPVAEPMVRPVGRPVAVQASAPGVESVALACTAVMAGPEALDWAPGLVTAMVLVMAQVKLAEPEKPALSVAVIVTE